MANPIRIVCLSDTHGNHRRLAVPEGDLLLHAGDITRRGELDILEDFNRWLGELPHPQKLIIAGNHDFCFEREPEAARAAITNARYLQDDAVEISGLKFWGAPWQPWFFNWAFNLHRGDALAAKWALIPGNTDVLMTHGPPFEILDRTTRGYDVGCRDLLERLGQFKPKLHLFGHIHEAAGVRWKDGTLFVNASQEWDGAEPIVVDWDGERFGVVA